MNFQLIITIVVIIFCVAIILFLISQILSNVLDNLFGEADPMPASYYAEMELDTQGKNSGMVNYFADGYTMKKDEGEMN